MSARHGVDATYQQGFKLIERGNGTPREADEGLNDLQGVLDAMTEFTDQQLPLRLGVSQPQQGANRADEFHALDWFGQISVRDVLEIGSIIDWRRGRGRGLQH